MDKGDYGREKKHMARGDGWLYFKNRIYVPWTYDFRRGIMEEVHCNPYAIHESSTKIYQDLKKNWWLGMKRSIVEFIPESTF